MILIQEYTFENVVCKMASILFHSSGVEVVCVMQ